MKNFYKKKKKKKNQGKTHPTFMTKIVKLKIKTNKFEKKVTRGLQQAFIFEINAKNKLGGQNVPQ